MTEGLKTDDKQLARLCASGDNDARKELYTRYAARVYALCRRYISDESAAQDAMHDVMIKAFGRIGRYEHRGEGSLYSWLARMAVNHCIDELRSRTRRPIWSLEESMADQLPEPEPPDVRNVPRDVLMRLISELPDTRRMIFNLYCIEGIPHKEIAALLGITERASTSMLAKARKTLAAKINDYLKHNR